MTELRAFAERVLFGDALADKLAPPGDLVDLAPGPALVAAPGAPGRPAALRLDLAPDVRAEPPPEGRLDDPRARGRLLHAFANHELLALELFALALLRFPDAPAGFRLGLGRVMQEEQAHLAGYLARMEALGVRFGDEAPSAFFWTALAPARSPKELVAGLSLTFEQANLDFAAHFARVLRRVGDEETAALLDRVLADEVGHVRHGATWFARWQDPPATHVDWTAWTAALPRPLVPRRARGKGALQREARRAAGLTDGFVRRLALAGESTGRTPVVHAFLPGFEEALAGEPPSAAAEQVRRDQATLPVFLARRGDVVLVPDAPEPAWLEALAAVGVELPELVTSVDALEGRPLSGLAPWGWDPAARALLAPLLAQAREQPPDPARVAELASKATAAAWRRELLEAHPAWAPVVGPGALDDAGVVCADAATAREAVGRITAGGRRAAVKAPWGTSGRGAVRVDGALDAAQAAWLARVLERQGAVVVEPWLARTADLSVQLDVSESGARVRGVTRFLADRRGQYAGHVVGPHDAGLDPAARRLLGERAAGAPSGLDVLRAAAADVGERLARAGHRGPAGVDALVFRDAAGGLRLRPLVEVNPRTTMGRVALALRERLAPGRVGLWLHVPAPRARRAGHASLAALGRAAAERLPAQAEGGRLVAGALATNDPGAARVVLGLLLVAEDLAGCLAAAGALRLEPPPPR
ncbi:MAG: ferritin-like domain-containing protein [Planctomycetes bacterium]|nr:ferritin-like domain-containing protein [Planctomycetota bacterium]